MGDTGDRATDTGAGAAEALKDDLSGLGHVTLRKMFGGHGVFLDDVMFGIVDSSGHCFLRADDESAPEFEALGSEKHGRMPYWAVPGAVRDDLDRLVEWAGRAHAVALSSRH